MKDEVYPGADESTPSLAQYFSWINHTNEGPTEKQTLANLAFFQWMHDAFGMKLDINPFECPAVKGKCDSYCIPLAQRHASKEIEVFLLGNNDCAKSELAIEVWVTAFPPPHVLKTVTLRAAEKGKQ